MFIYKIARPDLSQFNSKSDNHAHPSPFVQRAPRSLNALLGLEGDVNEAIAYAYLCPKKRAEERQRFQQKAISRVFASDLERGVLAALHYAELGKRHEGLRRGGETASELPSCAAA